MRAVRASIFSNSFTRLHHFNSSRSSPRAVLPLFFVDDLILRGDCEFHRILRIRSLLRSSLGIPSCVASRLFLPGLHCSPDVHQRTLTIANCPTRRMQKRRGTVSGSGCWGDPWRQLFLRKKKTLEQKKDKYKKPQNVVCGRLSNFFENGSKTATGAQTRYHCIKAGVTCLASCDQTNITESGVWQISRSTATNLTTLGTRRRP